MKFSYRVLLLLALGIAATVAFVAWLTVYDRKQQRVLLPEEVQSQRPRPERKRTTAALVAYGDHKLVEGHVRNRTQGRSRADGIRLHEANTHFKTLDIMTKLNEEAGMHGKMIFTPPVRSRTGNDERDLPGKRLRIIVVPHSHNDPGWHKTVDGYFADQTRHILDNMVEKLLKYPKMTFIFAESVFLALWWKDLKEDVRRDVRRLIKRRQLEIVSGGWILTDEANCHYSAIIDQMTVGHHWLRDNIGVVPRTSWSLDPFGYSSFHPYLYKHAGYENAVILRVSGNMKSRLSEERGMEFFWRQMWDQGNETDFFTLMMPYMLYNIKHSCGPDPDICLQFDFRKVFGEMSESKAEPIHEGNVDRLAKLLLKQYQKKADLYQHGVVLIPVGDDFRYDRSEEWDQQFKNYMLLFNHINSKKAWNVEIRFGTVQDYFDEVKKVVAVSKKRPEEYFPTLSGDFFPYTDHSDEYWTGYFTTRPYSKALGRELEVYLRAAEMLNTMCLVAHSSGVHYDRQEVMGQLELARQHLGLFQHHDAIAGTATVWVVQDNEMRLFQGLHLARSVINTTVSFLLSSATQTPVAIRVLDTLNERIVSPTHGQTIHLNENRVRLIVFNPVARQRRELIQVVVNRELVEVFDSDGLRVASQLSPVWGNDHEKLPSSFVLSFLAEFPALGFSTFVLTPTVSQSNHVAKVTTYYGQRLLQGSNDLITIENEILQANISLRKGQLFSLGVKESGMDIQTNLKFLFYTSRRSGAYIFAPEGPAVGKDFARPLHISLIVGPVYSEVRIQHSCVTQILRLLNCSGPLGSILHLDNIVNMTTEDYDEKELIMRLDTSVKSRDLFYTDQNAFHTMKRRRLVNFPLEANYYPACSGVYIEDKKLRLSVLTAQPVGVSSLKQGSIEVMLDRRLKYDDGRGLGAGVQDNKIVLSRFYILPEMLVDAAPDDPNLLSMPTMLSNVLADAMKNYPIVTMSNYKGKLPTLSLVESPLPCDVLLVNLKSFGNASNTAALILHKQGYSAAYQSPGAGNECGNIGANIHLGRLFHKMKVRDVFESGLSFVQRKQKLKRHRALKLEPMELYAYEIDYD